MKYIFLITIQYFFYTLKINHRILTIFTFFSLSSNDRKLPIFNFVISYFGKTSPIKKKVNTICRLNEHIQHASFLQIKFICNFNLMNFDTNFEQI